MNNIKAVIFDIAGTLADHGCCAPVIAFQDVLKSVDIELASDIIREDMGLAKAKHIEKILLKNNLNPDLGTGLEELFYKRIREVALDPFFTASTIGFDPMYHLLENLRKKGIKLASSTGYPTALGQQIIERGHMGDYIDIVCGHEYGTRPTPWLIYRAMRELDVYPAYKCVKVGDTVADIEAGVNAGVWTVGVIETGNLFGVNATELEDIKQNWPQEYIDKKYEAMEKFRIAGADYTVNNLTELEEVLNNIEYCIDTGERPYQTSSYRTGE
jgi:phosphonoacetaldehyde hydrolase